MDATSQDWQEQALTGLKELGEEAVPGLELLFLDGLAAHLFGPDAPEPPYTLEEGSAVVSLLLRAVSGESPRV